MELRKMLLNPNQSKWNSKSQLQSNKHPHKNWLPTPYPKSKKLPRNLQKNQRLANLLGPWQKSNRRKKRRKRLMISLNSPTTWTMISTWKILKLDKHSKLLEKGLMRLNRTKTGRRISQMSGIRPLRLMIKLLKHKSREVFILTVSINLLIF